jgi:hypothetical protein
MLNELFGFLVSSANPAGDVVAPVDHKDPVTDALLDPSHAGRISVVDSLM